MDRKAPPLKIHSPKVGKTERLPLSGRRLLSHYQLFGRQEQRLHAATYPDAHDGQLPPKSCVTFCNTGKERQETLAFADRVQREWNVPIVWLEFVYNQDAKGGNADPKRTFQVVDLETASRSGKPFESFITERRMLPNATTRACTSDLKVSTVDRYVRRRLGWPKVKTKNVIGIRYDEPRRWQKALTKECRTEYPMVHARVSQADVQAFWREQPFDLGIHSAQGNCDLCFMKGYRKLLATIRDEPHRAAWWIERAARTVGLRELRNRSIAQFNERLTYQELHGLAISTPTFAMSALNTVPVESQFANYFCTD